MNPNPTDCVGYPGHGGEGIGGKKRCRSEELNASSSNIPNTRENVLKFVLIKLVYSSDPAKRICGRSLDGLERELSPPCSHVSKWNQCRDLHHSSSTGQRQRDDLLADGRDRTGVRPAHPPHRVSTLSPSHAHRDGIRT